MSSTANKENESLHSSSPAFQSKQSKPSASNGAKSSSKSKPKTSSKSPLSDEDRTKKHFKSLLAQIEGGHWKNALKTCDKSALFVLFPLFLLISYGFALLYGGSSVWIIFSD